MPSQFFGLTIAGSGLRASNAALNTTANNISNAQTTGYSRQQVTQQAENALRVFTTYGCAGAGVDTIAIERIRDSFYDVKFWNNNTKYGEFSAKQYYMRNIEDYLKDEAASGFKTIFNKLSASLQSVTTNASSTETKASFIASAKALTDYFNNMYGNFQELQKDLNLEIKQNVDQINSISEKIATLNKQINVIELSSPNTVANELRDQRDLLIDELSEIVDVSTVEYPVTDVNHPEWETGGTRYIVRIAGGQPLVDGSDYNQLAYEARGKDEKVNQSDVDGLYQIKWENGNTFSMRNADMGGKLKGLIELRDGNNNANFHGKVTAVNGNTVKVQVSDGYLKDMQNCTLSETGGVIDIANATYYYKSWSFEEDLTATPPTYTYVFEMDPTHAGSSDKVITAGAEAKTESEINYQGIPYYMTQMNAWIRGFAQAVNDIFSTGTNHYGEEYGNVGNPDGKKSCYLFNGCSLNGDEYTESQLCGPDDTNHTGYYKLTAGNITINAALLENADLLGTRSSASVGVEECGKIEEMIEMLTSREKFSFRNGTAGQMLESLLSDAALGASNANTFCGTYEGLKNSIDNQRNSISGVDEDEEAVSLVKYQNSYTLASKMIQTLTEVYDQLILRTGV